MSELRSDSRPARRSSPAAAKSADHSRTDRQRRSSGLAWFMAGLMLAMVFVIELPNEIVAWRFAAALEARKAGDKERADQLLAEVLARRPDEHRYQFQQYLWNLDDGNYEKALEYLKQRFPTKPSNTESAIWLLSKRSSIYLHLRRYPEAIADCRELKRINETTGQPERAEVLNGLAYARALGDLELDEALVDIDAAILESRAELRDLEQKLQVARRSGKNTLPLSWAVANQQRSLGGCLDTRGFVRMKLGQVVRAQFDFNEALKWSKQAEQFYRTNQRAIAGQSREYREYEDQLRELDRHLAVILYHRSLSLELLGRTADAERDFSKATS